MINAPSLSAALGLVMGCALLSVCLIVLLRPILERYALARPNHRSMHTKPTAQGGGIAVLLSVIGGCGAVLSLDHLAGSDTWRLVLILATAAALAAVGAMDDLRNLPVAPRFIAHVTAGALMLIALPDGLRVLPDAVPLVVERAMLMLAVVWFINLTNFMDGMDWMTVAEVVPIAAAIGIFWLLGLVDAEAGVTAFALLGATLGFAPFNKHPARLFLGDVGSLPIGLLLAWMLALVAAESLAAALLLPLYYLADATITLLRRLRDGEAVTQAHRTHFYQRAVAGGYAAPDITARVFTLNLGLAVLAGISLLAGPGWVGLACFMAGATMTAWLLRAFAKGRT